MNVEYKHRAKSILIIYKIESYYMLSDDYFVITCCTK